MKDKSAFTNSDAKEIMEFIDQMHKTSLKELVAKEQIEIASQFAINDKKVFSEKKTSGNGQVKCLPPICNMNSQILILGNAPGKESLRKQEYYSYPRNIFWKLIEEIIGEPAPIDYEERKNYLLENGIALWDMCKECKRPGSLDKSTTEEEPNDICGFIAEHPYIKLIGFNGKRAYEIFLKYVGDIDGIKTLKLPSSSPTNAGITWEEKLKIWKKMKLCL